MKYHIYNIITIHMNTHNRRAWRSRFTSLSSLVHKYVIKVDTYSRQADYGFLVVYVYIYIYSIG